MGFRRKVALTLFSALLIASVALAAEVTVTIFWAGPPAVPTIDPDPVVVTAGDTIKFVADSTSWPASGFVIMAGPPLNWDSGFPLTPGNSWTTPPVTAAPGTYGYTVQFGETLGDTIQGTVIVMEPMPAVSQEGLAVLILLFAASAAWMLRHRRGRQESPPSPRAPSG